MMHNLFRELGLTQNTEAVFNRLLHYGPASARHLAENLNIPRPSVYDQLKILIKYGLAVEKYEDNRKIFAVDDLNHIPQLIENKIELLQSEQKKIKAALPTLINETRTLEPKIRFYSGVDGVRQILRDLLWYKNIKTITMWPISEMIELLGRDYMENLNRKRIKNNISIRGIWPKDKIVDFEEYPFMGVGKGFLRELRTAPPSMTWHMSHWVYDDKTAFISSKNETFGFLIHSHDFANFMRAQFEVIWPLSKPIKPAPQYTDAFLKTLKNKNNET